MVKQPKVTGIGGFLTDSPARGKNGDKKHPDRLNLILYRENKMSRYQDWFGNGVSEEKVYCDFFGVNPTDSTTLKRNALFSLIHMISTGKLEISIPQPPEEETPVES